MLGLGAVNGEMVNELPVNAGRFIVTLEGICSLAIPATLTATRRAGISASAMIALPAVLATNRRRGLGGDANLQFTAAVTSTRRRAAVGSAVMAISAGMALNRRLTLKGLLPVVISGTTVLSYKYLHHAPQKRVALLNAQNRSIEVVADSRTIAVPPRPSAIMVPTGRRAGE